MTSHRRFPPPTNSSLVLARDLQRTLNEIIKHEHRRAHRVWVAALASLVAKAIHSLPEEEP